MIHIINSGGTGLSGSPSASVEVPEDVEGCCIVCSAHVRFQNVLVDAAPPTISMSMSWYGSSPLTQIITATDGFYVGDDDHTYAYTRNTYIFAIDDPVPGLGNITASLSGSVDKYGQFNYWLIRGKAPDAWTTEYQGGTSSGGGNIITELPSAGCFLVGNVRGISTLSGGEATLYKTDTYGVDNSGLSTGDIIPFGEYYSSLHPAGNISTGGAWTAGSCTRRHITAYAKPLPTYMPFWPMTN